jgi:hypothetical protein
MKVAFIVLLIDTATSAIVSAAGATGVGAGEGAGTGVGVTGVPPLPHATAKRVTVTATKAIPASRFAILGVGAVVMVAELGCMGLAELLKRQIPT